MIPSDGRDLSDGSDARGMGARGMIPSDGSDLRDGSDARGMIPSDGSDARGMNYPKMRSVFKYNVFL